MSEDTTFPKFKTRTRPPGSFPFGPQNPNQVWTPIFHSPSLLPFSKSLPRPASGPAPLAPPLRLDRPAPSLRAPWLRLDAVRHLGDAALRTPGSSGARAVGTPASGVGLRARRDSPIPPCSWIQPSPQTPPDPTPEPTDPSGPPDWGSGAPRLPRRHQNKGYLNEAMSNTCSFGHRPRLARKLHTQPQGSLSVTKTASEKKEVSPKKIEKPVSLKNTDKKPSPKSIEHKDTLPNQQSSSFLKENTGERSKDIGSAKPEKKNDCCLQDIDDESSESTGDGEEDTSGEDDEHGHPPNATQAPLELMAEFLRAEMSRDYHLAKKLCQMILIYEPENPEAKEFFTLIEEMLLKEKAQNVEEEAEDSEEGSSSESEGESTEEASEESSEEGEEG
ncbi:PREDICTED: glutamate-rich protein 2 [Dipodomys ordii]|uniref:Glutamate-rich protein 2 n=1 Tax=Dipodomys ordii TaxID=10020 RepID=A0A1S3G473_DIPOR|nr:PREDICTED: glutamate-rich protein 2 [Dipodomys ordii]